jgi:diguanylate cyclase (GGDEF)-like protein/PAS domain S-box-containing protein
MKIKSQIVLKVTILLAAAVSLFFIALSSLKIDLSGLDLSFALLSLSSLWIGVHAGLKVKGSGRHIPLFYLNVFIALLLFDHQAVILMAALAAIYFSIREHESAPLILFNSLFPVIPIFFIYQALHFYFGSQANILLSNNLLISLSFICLIQTIAHSITVRVNETLEADKQLVRQFSFGDFLQTFVGYVALAAVAGLLVKLTTTFELPQLTVIAAICMGTFLIYLFLVSRDSRSMKAQPDAELSITPLSEIKLKPEVKTKTEPQVELVEFQAAPQVNLSEARPVHALMPAETPAVMPQAVLPERGSDLFRQAFEHAPIAATLISTKGECLYVNKPLRELLGYTPDEFKSFTVQRFLHPDDASEFQISLTQLVKGETNASQFERRLMNKNGHEVWALCNAASVPSEDSAVNHLLIQVQDITKRKESEEALLRNAFHDALTGLPNRALFIDHLKLAINRTQRLEGHIYTVLFIDLDRFKLINDSLGHLVGDHLLINIAQKLEQCLRPGDTIARVGGDEFTVLLEDLFDESEAISIANRIQKDLSAPFMIDGREVFTTVSIGVAPSSPGYENPSDILRDADTAMYRAKLMGKNRYEIFDKAMHEVAIDLLQMETDLRHALERREFFIQYQPIVSLDNFSLRGFEALVRWRHPERGLISPLDFIPIAEDTGQIIQIGKWVLTESCKQMTQWQSQYGIDKPLFVSVNLSGKQFAQPDLVEQIKDVLQETGINPRCLKLEITESMVMENVETTTKMLYQLRDLGVQLSIDDFGTGYSSLSYLHRFPIDTLKIDRSFVIKMIDNNENIEIVRTIIILAQNLGMDVIAEGVETKEQLRRLRELKCENGQGYYFSKPLEAEDAETLLADVCTEGKARENLKKAQEEPVVNTRVKSIKISPIAYL